MEQDKFKLTISKVGRTVSNRARRRAKYLGVVSMGRKWHATTALLLGFALIAGACGSDDEEAATTAAPAATTATTAAPAATTAAPAAQTGASEAQNIVEKYSTRPEAVGLIDVPIDGDIPSGKKISYVSCGPEACEQLGNLVSEAGEILGWTTTVIPTSGAPGDVNEVFESLVRNPPDGLVYSSIPNSQVGRYLEELSAAGTLIANISMWEPMAEEVIWSVFGPDDMVPMGEGMAAWVVDDAAKKGDATPGVVYVDLPEIPIVTPMAERFAETFARLCPGCAYENLGIGIADIPNIPDRVVSILRAKPDIGYVVMSADSLGQGIPAAAKAAGLEITMFGNAPGLLNLALIDAGAQAGTMLFPFYETTFGAVDAFARMWAGQEVLPALPTPHWLITTESLPNATAYVPITRGLVEHYTELWGKG
jgi:ribose transport system substrate-binding protein